MITVVRQTCDGIAQVGLLGRFIGVREPNLKYLGLENMVRLAEVPAVMKTVSKCAAVLPVVACYPRILLPMSALVVIIPHRFSPVCARHRRPCYGVQAQRCIELCIDVRQFAIRLPAMKLTLHEPIRP